MIKWRSLFGELVIGQDKPMWESHSCNCVGPQNGEPLCPCAMRGVKIINGRYVLPERDLGPVKEVPR